MNRVIPLVDHRHAGLPARAGSVPAPGQPLLDQRARALRDLRISVTDRCNFRCGYCMPRDVFDASYQFMPQSDLLSFEEITRLAGLFAGLGVEKIRLTGGEPLLRKHLERLVAMLAELRTPAGRPLDLTLTTNGILLARKAQALRDAGLRRVTVSLDALDETLFRSMSDADFSPDDVLRGIDAAARAGLAPVKVNMVVRRGVNDHQILPLARRFRGTGHVLRFIEYMDVGNTNGWNMQEVVPGAEVLARIGEAFPLRPLSAQYAGEVAERWAYDDGEGEIGIITSVTQAFCGDCNRARLSPEGRLFLCLFASGGHDLRRPLRDGASDARMLATLAGIWGARDDAYSERRGSGEPTEAPGQPRVEMSYIGG